MLETGYHILEENQPIHPKSDEHPLMYVFSIGDKHYFQFVNPQSLYYERYMAMEDKFREAEMKVTEDFLQEFVKSMRVYLNKGELSEIGNMIIYLEQRLNYLPSVEQLYNICSVWFFDQNESPYTFDHQYAWNKIELWKQHKEALAFFLQTDLQKFFPSWAGLEISIQSYTKAIAQQEKMHLTYHLQKLSKLGVDQDLANSIESRLETLRTLIASVE